MEESMSMNSYMQQKPVASKAATTTTGGSGSPHEPDQESGWTAYFEDFSNNINREEEEDSYCSSFGSPSLVSDAASCAAWKLSNKHHHHHDVATTKMPNKLRFKKPRTKQISDDDPLEDTASSPVNSPKVSDLEPVDHMKPRKPDDHMYSSLGKEAASSGHYSELQQKERRMNFHIGKKNDCTDLKRRGLCLVPMSMLVNYLG